MRHSSIRFETFQIYLGTIVLGLLLSSCTLSELGKEQLEEISSAATYHNGLSASATLYGYNIHAQSDFVFGHDGLDWHLYRDGSYLGYLGSTLYATDVGFSLPNPITPGDYSVRASGYVYDAEGYGQWGYQDMGPLYLPNSDRSVTYRAHTQHYGWHGWVVDEAVAGTTGQSLRLEAAQIQLINMPNSSICYQAYVPAKGGWMSTVCNGATAGTTGEASQMEAIKIWLVNAPSGCNIRYQAHISKSGWLPVVFNGEIAGTTNTGRRMEAFAVRLSGTCQ